MFRSPSSRFSCRAVVELPVRHARRMVDVLARWFSGRRRTASGRAGLWLIALGGAAMAGNGLAIDPGVACQLLDDHGLRTRGGYRELGHGEFRCASIDYRFPPGAAGGDELRYSASGTRGRVNTLQLELALRSQGDLRPVLDPFVSLADLLSRRSVGSPLPSAARQALATGLPGAWRIDGAEVAIERVGGLVPLVRLVIR